MCVWFGRRTSSEGAALPYQLKWVFATRKRLEEKIGGKQNERQEESSAVSWEGQGKETKRSIWAYKAEDPGVRLHMKRKYARDTLTLPGMVVIYNTLLAMMMFHIENRASSL